MEVFIHPIAHPPVGGPAHAPPNAAFRASAIHFRGAADSLIRMLIGHLRLSRIDSLTDSSVGAAPDGRLAFPAHAAVSRFPILAIRCWRGIDFPMAQFKKESRPDVDSSVFSTNCGWVFWVVLIGRSVGAYLRIQSFAHAPNSWGVYPFASIASPFTRWRLIADSWAIRRSVV